VQIPAVDVNSQWNEESRRCFGMVRCIDGSHEKNGVCVKDPVEPVAQVEPQEQPVSPVERTDIPPEGPTSSRVLCFGPGSGER
jgi:hypothetical protein